MRSPARNERYRAASRWLVLFAGTCALLGGCDAAMLQTDLSAFGSDFLRQVLAAYLL